MNIFDRLVSYVSPSAGLKRVSARKRMEILEGANFRKYDGASRGRRTQNWRTTSSSADVEISAASRTLRDRSRDLVRNNPTATGIVSTWANYLVGTGIKPRSSGPDADRNRLVDDLFAAWAKNCYSDGTMDFYGIQNLVARTMVESGEVLVRRRVRRPQDNLRIPLQLQVLEPEFIDETRQSDPKRSRSVVNGIEFDVIGRRRGYWMHQNHPGSGDMSVFSNQSKFVPSSEICHVYEKNRTQVRGAPWLASCIIPLRDVDEYNQSEAVRKKIEACVVGVVIPGDNEVPDLGLEETVDGDSNKSNGVTDANGFPIERFEPGMFAYLENGKDVKFNNPAISVGMEMYLRTQYRRIANGSRMPYELLTGDWSQANFATGRIGMLNFRRLVTSIQHNVIIHSFCQPTWDWFIDMAIAVGALPEGDYPCEWQPPEFEDIQPIDDARADLLNIRMGKKSLKSVIAKSGRNPDQVMKEIIEMNKILDDNEVVLDSDPRRVAVNGQIQWGQDPNANGDGNEPN